MKKLLICCSAVILFGLCSLVYAQDLKILKKELTKTFNKIQELKDVKAQIVENNILLTGSLPNQTAKIYFDKIMEKYKENKDIINLVSTSIKFKQFNRNIIKKYIGIEGVDVRIAADKLYLLGEVYSSEEKTKAEEIAKKYFDDVINLLKIKKEVIKLKIKVVEVNRAKVKEFNRTSSNLTANAQWSRTEATTTDEAGVQSTLTKGWNINVASDFLTNLNWWVTKGWAKVISEPEILTLSDEEAKFVSGGEISYTVLNADGSPSVEWKEYGIISKIIPTIISDNKIKLKIDIEVSEILPEARSGQLQFTKRNASTALITKPGNSVIIAGLYRKQEKDITKRVPILSSIPPLSLLYNVIDKGKIETEAVIIIYPDFAYIDSTDYNKLIPEEDIKGKIQLQNLEMK